MKIRLSPQTLRVRLGRAEVQGLAKGQPLHLELALPGQPLGFALSVEDADGVLHTQGHVRIHLCAEKMRRWAQSQQERYPFEPGALRVHIERDFACTTPRADGSCADDVFERPPSTS